MSQPIVISFVNTKGGVGKTTSAILTGLALHARGHTVQVRDTDVTGGAWYWGKQAMKAGDPLPFDVVTCNERSVRDLDTDVDYVLIDTAPELNKTIGEAIELISDLIVIVAKPGTLDMDRTSETYGALKGSVVVLLNMVKTNTITTAESIRSLEDDNYAYFETLIADREAIHRAAGTATLPKGSGYEEVVQEIITNFEQENRQ